MARNRRNPPNLGTLTNGETIGNPQLQEEQEMSEERIDEMVDETEGEELVESSERRDLNELHLAISHDHLGKIDMLAKDLPFVSIQAALNAGFGHKMRNVVASSVTNWLNKQIANNRENYKPTQAERDAYRKDYADDVKAETAKQSLEAWNDFQAGKVSSRSGGSRMMDPVDREERDILYAYAETLLVENFPGVRLPGNDKDTVDVGGEQYNRSQILAVARQAAKDIGRDLRQEAIAAIESRKEAAAKVDVRAMFTRALAAG
jgi:hypothetical protein